MSEGWGRFKDESQVSDSSSWMGGGDNAFVAPIVSILFYSNDFFMEIRGDGEIWVCYDFVP